MDRSRSSSTWREFADAAPTVAAVVRARLEAADHHVVATLRSDGSPRVNGTNVLFDGDELLIGCMPGTRRATDLRRDPRCALHTAPDAPTMPDGDARLDGLVVELDRSTTAAIFARDAARRGMPDDQPMEGDLFALRLTAVSTIKVVDDHLELQLWTPATGVREIHRR
ncbi:MAG: pyridoxamine 5'-phosphate oxidase family protein [Actinomycetes bacterium]